MLNDAIKQKIAGAGLKQWQIADALNVNEGTLCRWLRHELTEDQRARILDAIERGKQENEARSGSN